MRTGPATARKPHTSSKDNIERKGRPLTTGMEIPPSRRGLACEIDGTLPPPRRDGALGLLRDVASATGRARVLLGRPAGAAVYLARPTRGVAGGAARPRGGLGR